MPCSSSSQPSQHVLSLGLKTAPLSLDPRDVLDVASYRVIQRLYHGLVRLEAQSRIVPDLAPS